MWSSLTEQDQAHTTPILAQGTHSNPSRLDARTWNILRELGIAARLPTKRGCRGGHKQHCIPTVIGHRPIPKHAANEMHTSSQMTTLTAAWIETTTTPAAVVATLMTAALIETATTPAAVVAISLTAVTAASIETAATPTAVIATSPTTALIETATTSAAVVVTSPTIETATTSAVVVATSPTTALLETATTQAAVVATPPTTATAALIETATTPATVVATSPTTGVARVYHGQIGTYLLSGSRFVSGNVHEKQRRIETVTSRRPQIHVHCRGVRHANLHSLCKHGGYTRLPSRWELLNARSARENKDLISEHIVDHNTDTLFQTETWLPQKETPTIKELTPSGYRFIGAARPKAKRKANKQNSTKGRGLAIIHRRDFKVYKTGDSAVYQSFEYLDVKVITPCSTVRAQALYRPPNSAPSTIIPDFSTLLANLGHIAGPLMIVEDFNIHIDDRNSALTKTFLQLLDEYGMTHHINTPTHKNGHILDLFNTKKSCRHIARNQRHRPPDLRPLFSCGNCLCWTTTKKNLGTCVIQRY